MWTSFYVLVSILKARFKKDKNNDSYIRQKFWAEI